MGSLSVSVTVDQLNVKHTVFFDGEAIIKLQTKERAVEISSSSRDTFEWSRIKEPESNIFDSAYELLNTK